MQKALAPQHLSENDCITCDAAEDSEETDIPLPLVYVAGRPLCNLRFAHDIALLGCSEQELQHFTERPD